MLKLQSDSIRLHRNNLEDGDKTPLAEVLTKNFTEVSIGSHVLLEPVTGPKDRLHTRRTDSYLIAVTIIL